MGRDWLRRQAGVLAEPNFRRFYAGYVTSLFGSAMSTVAIAWAVLDSGAGATGLGYVFAAAVVPQVLLLAVAGAVADRLGRRRVMLAADALRCVAQASLTVAVFAGRPALWVFVLPAGPAVVVAADAASYAVSVVALSLLTVPAAAIAEPSPGRTLWRDMAEDWTEFRSRSWLWVVTVQFAFFNLITWAPWMLLGPVMGRAYLGGASVWGVIMALHAPAGWVAAAAFGCGAGSATLATYCDTAMQQQVPPAMLARVSSLMVFPAYGVGVIGYAIDGPLAAAFGPAAVFGVGAVYGLLSSAVVLALPSVRAVRWVDTGSG